MKTISHKFDIYILVFALVFSIFLLGNASAASFSLGSVHGTVDTNSLIVTENKTLTVSNVPAGDTLAAYKIIDVFYNQSSNSITYEFTADFKNYLASSNEYRNLTIEDYTNLTSGDITTGSINSTSSLDRLASKYATYIKEHNINGSALTTNGNNRSASLPLGSYLIIPTSTSKIYAVMVGNLSLSEMNGEWTSNNQTIVGKISEPGVVTKTLVGNKETDSTHIGTEFTYNITGSVPHYPTNATNKKYTIIDTMSSGLTFSGITSVNISDGTTRLTVNANGRVTNASGALVASITVSGQVITIDFNLDNITSSEITITYKAKLNDNATVGGNGNKNEAKLTYSNDPYGTSTHDSEPSTTTVYTYGIEILKYSGIDKTAVLEGATFDIYSDIALTTKIGSFTTDEDGYAEYIGIPAGTYYLKETKAPNGHILLTDAVTIEVAGNNSTLSPTDSGYYYAEISNNKNLFLPFTGGMGTYAYTIIGLLIIVISVVIYIIYRKRSASKDENEK